MSRVTVFRGEFAVFGRGSEKLPPRWVFFPIRRPRVVSDVDGAQARLAIKQTLTPKNKNKERAARRGRSDYEARNARERRRIVRARWLPRASSFTGGCKPVNEKITSGSNRNALTRVTTRTKQKFGRRRSWVSKIRIFPHFESDLFRILNQTCSGFRIRIFPDFESLIRDERRYDEY